MLHRTRPLLTLGQPTVMTGAARGLMQRTMTLPMRLNAPAPEAIEPSLLAALPAPVGQAWEDCLSAGSPTLADLLGRLCVSLQIAARQPVHGHRIVPTPEQDVVELAIAIHTPEIALRALQCAVGMMDLIGMHPAQPERAAALADTFMTQHGQEGWLSAHTLSFMRSARRLGIPWQPVAGPFIQLGWGARACRIDSAFSGRTSLIGVQIARAKPFTNTLLAQSGLPVPRQQVARSESECLAAAAQIGYPVVVKPPAEDGGEGVWIDLHTPEDVRQAYARAATQSAPQVLVEQQVAGEDHRLLVVKNRLVAAARRRPAQVTGDGHLTVRELVDQLNQDPRRGHHKHALLQHVPLDPAVIERLAAQGLSPDSVPAPGRTVLLRKEPNISVGGTAEDVTAVIHPDNADLAIRAARIVGLDIAGVDMLCPDITRSWREVGGAICEVNSQPGFRPHWLGNPDHDVNDDVLLRLFDDGDGRIPLVSITGAPGHRLARTVQRLLMQQGMRVGRTTRERGIWLDDTELHTTPLATHHAASQLLLIDPVVEAAVLELPLGAVRNEGFAYDRCDVAVLVDLSDLSDSPDIPEPGERRLWAREALERARKAVVVNAQDPHGLTAARRIQAPQVLLVAEHANDPVLARHLAAGHRGATWGGDAPALWEGATAHPLPAAGQATDVWAAAVAWALGVSPRVIPAQLAVALTAASDARPPTAAPS